MLYAHDIRIGNWFEYEGKHYQVTKIKVGENAEGEYPITLTENLLVKMGFEYLWKDRYGKNGVDLFFTCEGCLLMVEERSNFSLVYQYVHQIQNLYYFLTGEELEIDLTALAAPAS